MNTPTPTLDTVSDEILTTILADTLELLPTEIRQHHLTRHHNTITLSPHAHHQLRHTLNQLPDAPWEPIALHTLYQHLPHTSPLEWTRETRQQLRELIANRIPHLTTLHNHPHYHLTPTPTLQQHLHTATQPTTTNIPTP